MKIVAKSNTELQQLNDRKKKGFKYLELQLTATFLSDDFDMNKCFKNILNHDWDILSIHMPLIPGGEDINLEYFSFPQYLKVFYKTCDMAQRCAEFYNHEVSIIIHSGFSIRMFNQIPGLFTFIKNLFSQCIQKYPQVTYSFENVCALNIRNDYIAFNNVVFDENAELAKHFNKILNTHKFYSTIDICHALINMKLFNNMSEEHKMKKFLVDLDFYFKQNKNNINNIHLNNFRNYGLDKMDHGADFSRKEDEKLLDLILELYKKYKYSCPITLELDELDYNNAICAYGLKRQIEKKL